MSTFFFRCACFFLASAHLTAQALPPFSISAGPESAYFLRMREGGTFQNGRLDGAHLTLEGINHSILYLAADYTYACGELKGHSASGASIRSHLTDEIFELRLGLNLEQPKAPSFIVPFVGWGLFREINHFRFPSPLPCTFTDRFNYLVAGFLSGIYFTPQFSFGINFKLRFMQEATSHVTDDPYNNDVTLMMEEEIHTRLELPLAYLPKRSWLFNAAVLSPFFEFRHFGGREGYPYNFKDTKYYLYGARLALVHFF